MKFNISSMLKPRVYDHSVKHVELIETHISWVLLTGVFAYKIKKPVNFGFLDFSTLEKRRICCEQELRLNRRLAPRLYLDVVTITGDAGSPVVSGDGEVIEYAVKMREFPQSSQLDHMLGTGKLTKEHMDMFAEMVANFHQSCEVADDSMTYGNCAAVCQPVAENFSQINQHMAAAQYNEILGQLQQWSRAESEKLNSIFDKRKHDGFVRECHGDMHLRNLIWLENEPAAFDCIEFNASLRWIDVISEVAFLVMDLHDRKQFELANRFINTYLELTGDYAGMQLMRFYLGYRALVRAKVGVLRLEQTTLGHAERKQSKDEFESYLKLASSYTIKARPKLIIMRGMSASGKSTVSQSLVDSLGALRIRSDVERKRLYKISATAHAGSGIDAGIYTQQSSQKTDEKLNELSVLILNAGYSVIVDAAFLRHEQRVQFQLLAERLAVPYFIVETRAPAAVLRERIMKRKHDVSDADLAVLEHQLAGWQPLSNDETDRAVVVDTSETLELEALFERLGV